MASVSGLYPMIYVPSSSLSSLRMSRATESPWCSVSTDSITTVDSEARVTIATSKTQVSAIRNQLGEQVNVCVEPCRRDTFPAIALAAAYLHDVQGVAEGECVAVCPVDPYVDNSYYEGVKRLEELVLAGNANLTLMGIEPTYPSEKYGYIIPANLPRLSAWYVNSRRSLL